MVAFQLFNLFWISLLCLWFFLAPTKTTPCNKDVQRGCRQSAITKPKLRRAHSLAPNLRPILGVLAQEIPDDIPESSNETYIAASYVKFVEAGGARVVPIHLGRPNSTYPDILNSINGVLFPGGSASITDSFYAKVGKYIFDYAKQVNDNGDYFPIWATCLGFEMLAQFLVPDVPVTTSCSAYDLALPLNFTENATSSHLFAGMPDDIKKILTTEPVTANYHHKCLSPETVQSSGLSKLINVLSTNMDANGVEFVSTYEVIGYPFYGVIWHPEKNVWEWNTNEKNLPHSPDAMKMTLYFSEFLANEARKSWHQFESSSRESAELIYNINPYYSGKDGYDFEQVYKMKMG